MINVTQDQLDYVESILKKNVNGLTLDRLYDKADEIEDRATMSIILNRLKSLDKVIAIYSVYHHKENQEKGIDAFTENESPVDREIKELLGVEPEKPVEQEQPKQKTIISVYQRTKVKPISAEPTGQIAKKTNGNIRPNTMSGKVIMALYLFRNKNKALNLEEIADISGVEIDNIYQVLYRLISNEYVRAKEKISGKTYYEWTGIYSYPFPKMRDSDLTLTKYNYESYTKKLLTDIDDPIKDNQHNLPLTSPVLNHTLPQKRKPAYSEDIISQFDDAIKFHQEMINKLIEMKQKFMQ